MFANARDLVEAAGIFADDLKGLGTEVIDDLLGVGFPDSVDQAAAQIFANPVDGGGEFRLEAGYLELVAVLWVARPFAVELEGFAALHAWQWTEHGDSTLAIGDLHLRHAVGVFLIEVDDPLEDA